MESSLVTQQVAVTADTQIALKPLIEGALRAELRMLELSLQMKARKCAIEIDSLPRHLALIDLPSFEPRPVQGSELALHTPPCSRR